MQRWLEEEQKGPNLQGLGMSNSYHGEPYIPADIFNVSRLRMMPGTPTQLSGTPQSKVQREMVAGRLVGTCTVQ